MNQLERPEQIIAWELRGAWAAQKRLIFTLSERCEPRRIDGRVARVSATGAVVVIEETTERGFGKQWHVPTVDVLGTATPHFSQDEVAA